jgi:DNA helicase II / ATP-dependent DNA helicase PcrA
VLTLDLNPEQQAAATHRGGPLLIVAGAGTGKTHTLASRVAWLVHEGADAQRILLLTFSRRAAAEMAHRAGRLLQRSLGLPAHGPTLELPWCGTFHAIGARLLREEAPRVGLAPGFTVLDRADAQELLGLVRQQQGLHGSAQRFPLPATCAAIHSRCVNTRAALAVVLKEQFPWCAMHEAALARLFAAYADAKLQQHSLDYDDLLLAWWQLLQHPVLAARLRARFDHVLVDEVQDINGLQADIVLALMPTGDGFTAVGDDAQSIYGFRGAELRLMLELPKRFEPPAQVLTLTQNYRSTPQILAASNAVIAAAAERFDKQLWTHRASGCRVQLATVADEAAQARAVASAVLAERESGLALKRQAVLFRTGHHSAALELELVRRNVPFVKYGGLKFMEAAHVKDVLALLRWADNPASRLSALRVARLVPGLGPASLQRLVAVADGDITGFKPPPAAAEPWAALCAVLQHLRGEQAAWPADFAAALAWYQPHLERLHADARVRRADLEQLGRIAAGHASRRRFVTELTLEPPEASSDESGVPLRDEDYLILSTLHSSKGQEWNAVHILNVVDGCMPADISTGSTAEIEEERRLLYVGMTRARDRLTLWAPQRFHVTQQRQLGHRHLYSIVSRFIGPEVLAQLEVARPQGLPEPLAEPATAAQEAPLLDLAAALRGSWR